jgi:stringent starvation protein B
MEMSLAPTMRPYFLRAIHEWCHDQGFTPYVLVAVDDSCQVPIAYVQNGQIVLNVSLEATQGFAIDDEYLHFKGRFGGRAQEVFVPLVRVAAMYARENGQGMTFPVEAAILVSHPPKEQEDTPAVDRPTPPSGGRPTLRRIK